MSDLEIWLLAVSVLAVSALANLASRRIIEGRIKLEFDGKLESLKAEQRVREELLKSELRSAESQIAALRDGALSRRAARDALLDKRRIEAVEKLWEGLTSLAGYKMLVGVTTTMKSVIDDRVIKEPGFQKMFEAMLSPFPSIGPGSLDTKRQQPFLSAPAWAYFSAYQAIVGVCFVQAKMFSLGMATKESVLEHEDIRNLIIAALPNAGAALQKWGARSYFRLLDQIEEKLLEETNRSIEGAEVDVEQIKRSAEIVSLARSVSNASTEKLAKETVDRGNAKGS